MLKKAVSYLLLVLLIINVYIFAALAAQSTLPAVETFLRSPGMNEWVSQLHAGMGDRIECVTYVTLPENFSDYESYYFCLTEELSPGLIYEADSADIALYALDGANLTEYFTVEETREGLTATCTDLRGISQLDKDSTLAFSFAVTLSTKAVLGNPGNRVRSILEYSNDPKAQQSSLGCTEAVSATVFTYGLQICKVDMDTQLPVAEVEFCLRNEAGLYLLVREQNSVGSWVAEERKASTLVTDDAGQATIRGLDPGVYYLKETKAANGYQILEEALELTLTAEYSADGQVKNLLVAKGTEDPVASHEDHFAVAKLQVENTYGPELPPTGGAGASLYYIFGFLAIFAVCLICVAKYRAGDPSAA